MGVNEIIDKVKADSKKIAADIINEAKVEAKKITDESNLEAEKKKKAILENGEKQALLKKQRIIADAKLKSKRMEWDAKEELISEVLKKAQDELIPIKEKGYAGKSYAGILLKLVKEAAINAGGGDLEVVLCTGDSNYVSKEDIENIAKELQGELGECSLSLSDTEHAGLGGPILRAKSGNIEVDNTLEKRIERYTDTLRTEITRILFGG